MLVHIVDLMNQMKFLHYLVDILNLLVKLLMIMFYYVILLTIYEEHLNENVIEFLIVLLTNQYQCDVYLYNNQILLEILRVVHYH
jgi:hypothetical protein